MLAFINFLKGTIIPLARKHRELELHLSLLALFWLLSYQYSEVVLQAYSRLLSPNITLYCMPLMLLTTTFCLSLYLKYRPKYDKFLNVYWDKNDELHCPSCKRLLAPSFLGKSVSESDNKSVFQCNFCTKKVILKDNNGIPLSKAEAIKLKKSHI